jgi:hypothetical protein
LRDHERKHSGEQPFVCGVCGFRTAFRRSLSVHQRSHVTGVTVAAVSTVGSGASGDVARLSSVSMVGDAAVARSTTAVPSAA